MTLIASPPGSSIQCRGDGPLAFNSAAFPSPPRYPLIPVGYLPCGRRLETVSRAVFRPLYYLSEG